MTPSMSTLDLTKSHGLIVHLNWLLTYLVTQVLILGSGGLHIGQAGEFDYSGTQV